MAPLNKQDKRTNREHFADVNPSTANAKKHAEAIAYAADNGARVINLSLGGKRLTHAERLAIDYAFGKGAVIVVAAGNQGVDISDYGIASSDKVLAIAATGPDDQRAKFSNWGKIAVSAPAPTS